MRGDRAPGPRRASRRAALAAVATALLAGATACSLFAVPGLSDARERWAARGASSYTLVLESRCGERSLLGRYAITVDDGAVTDVQALNQTAKDSPPPASNGAFTVQELLDWLADLRPNQVLEAEFDDNGMPTHVVVDSEPEAIDDEACFDLSEYRPAS